MSTIGSSAGTLPVQHTVVNLIGIDAFLQLGTQFFARHFKRDFQQLAAVVKRSRWSSAAKMLLFAKVVAS